MANKAFDPGSMEQFRVLLKNTDSTKQIDITRLVVELHITEDIFKNTLYGHVHIRDAIDLLGGQPSSNVKNKFQIIGEEFIEISYKLKDKSSVKLRFATYKISDIVYHENNTKKEYTLHFCSEEHLIDAITLVQKSYNDVNSKNVENILNDYLKISDTTNGKLAKKLVNNQLTKGIQKVIIPRLPPLQACQFLAKRSISDQTFESATYLFFENFNGFNFCDIEYLIKLGREKIKSTDTKKSNPFVYFYEQPTVTDPKNHDPDRQYKTLISISHRNFFDTIQKLKMGMFESEMLVYDFANHNIIPTRFKFLNNTDGTNSNTLTLGNDVGQSFPENSVTFIKDHTSQTDNDRRFSRQFFIPKDNSFTSAETYLDIIIPARSSYFTRLAQNMFTIMTYGDSDIKAGDVIILNIPEGDSNNKSATNKYISGEYLICTTNHIFTQKTYMTRMDVYKNAFGAKVLTTEESKTTTITPTDNNSLSNDYNTPQTYVGYEEDVNTLADQKEQELSDNPITFFKNLIGL